MPNQFEPFVLTQTEAAPLKGVEAEDAARLPDDGEGDEIAAPSGNVAVDPGAEPFQTNSLAEVPPTRKEPGRSQRPRFFS